jgi:multidrug efflux pump subunit AcrA (membrane-fusion protein)
MWSSAAAIVVIGGGAGGYFSWKQYEASLSPGGIVSVNGRVEAARIDISSKLAGRVSEFVRHERDLVSPEEVIARIEARPALLLGQRHDGIGVKPFTGKWARSRHELGSSYPIH